MTYYEYVTLIEENKLMARNENIVNYLNKISYEGHVLGRIITHLINMLIFRLNNSIDIFTKNVLQDGVAPDKLAVHLAEIKKEINYVNSFAQVNILKSSAEQIKSFVLTFADNTEQTIKRSLADINNNEINSLINNLNLKEGII